MAVRFASLHIAGTIPVSIDVLKMMCKGVLGLRSVLLILWDVPGLFQEISRDLMSEAFYGCFLWR